MKIEDKQLDVNELKVGQVVYSAQMNECCEGWESQSFHKGKVLKITEHPNGRKEIDFSGDISTVYINKKGKNDYSYYGLFFENKEDILEYISECVLVN